jgi:hypothetical protein
MEVLLGVVLLTSVVMGLYACLTMAIGLAQSSRENLRATQILIEKMEIMRLYSWEQINDKDFWPKKFTEHLDPVGASNGAGGTVFSGSMSVKDGPGDVQYGDDVRTVTISISWGAKKKNDQLTREFVTYITKDGLQTYYF